MQFSVGKNVTLISRGSKSRVCTNDKTKSGADPGLQVRGSHLKKIIFFPILGGRRVRPPPWIRPCKF